MIQEWLAVLLLISGVAFLLIGSIGVIRLPDFYCRTHALSKPDTLGIILTMMGLAVYNGWNLDSAKLFFIVIFVAIANPAGTHALARAAMKNKLMPWVRHKEDRS